MSGAPSIVTSSAKSAPPLPAPCSTSTKPNSARRGRQGRSAVPSAAARHGEVRCVGANEDYQVTENPFFEVWTTPFGLPPFDRIHPEHFPRAFDRGMAEQSGEIAAITSTTGPPSFANTIEALERSGRLLDRGSRVFFNLDASA